MRVHDLVNVGLVGLGLVGIAVALWHARLSRSRVLKTLSWLAPASFLWFVGVFNDSWVGLILALLAMALYYSQTVSASGIRWWSLHVLRSRDPWVVRGSSPQEGRFLEELSGSLTRITKTEAHFANGKATAHQLLGIERERDQIRRLLPPNERWASALSEAALQIDLVLRIYANGATPPADVTEDEQAKWMDLRQHVRALRFDQPWPGSRDEPAN
ncbi:MAG: hypothetical protein ABI744_06745 [Chloroflexota bacterium]